MSDLWWRACQRRCSLCRSPYTDRARCGPRPRSTWCHRCLASSCGSPHRWSRAADFPGASFWPGLIRTITSWPWPVPRPRSCEPSISLSWRAARRRQRDWSGRRRSRPPLIRSPGAHPIRWSCASRRSEWLKRSSRQRKLATGKRGCGCRARSSALPLTVGCDPVSSTRGNTLPRAALWLACTASRAPRSPFPCRTRIWPGWSCPRRLRGWRQQAGAVCAAGGSRRGDSGAWAGWGGRA